MPKLVYLIIGLILASCGGEKQASAPHQMPQDQSVASTPQGQGPCASAPKDAVTIIDPWARAGHHAAMSAAYMTICNGYAHPVTFTGAASAAADKVEIHQTTAKAGGKMAMERINGLTIQAGGHHTLAPAGTHIMLINLSDALLAGEMLDLSLAWHNDQDETHTLAIKAAILDHAAAATRHQATQHDHGH